ncbi:hypothetical protein L6164_012149 [Bauhinia variegata]|uniref:Uncharacterized protein n=1 Tax=Bauhinia variegata TaxID=167791 RepID=A0ACB9PAP8_BAUVA|nr:hypothetical protein L6164_012149 [Bauhinia variegata]
MDRDKRLMRKYFDQLRFVFLCSLIICLASLFFLHHGFLYNGQNGVTFLLVKFADAKHGLVPKPSGFSGHSSGTIDCLIKPTNHTNQKASNREGNRREQMGPTLLIEDNVESVSKHHNTNLAPKPSRLPGNSSETIGFPTKPTSPSNETVSNGEGNWREQMGFTPLVENISEPVSKHPNTNLDPCYGKYVYMYDLPSRFNVDLVKNCHSLLKWFDMCPFMANQGLGPKVKEKPRGKVLSKKGWFVTNQFSLDLIFHNGMKNFKCLTNNSSMASAIYVPYYAGLDVGQYLWGYNVSIRDASPKALVKWLIMQPEWKKMWGRDHFMVGGRIGFDYRRRTDNDYDWGTKLMFLPEASNMSMLSIESLLMTMISQFHTQPISTLQVIMKLWSGKPE